MINTIKGLLTVCIITCHISADNLYAQDAEWSPEQVYYGSGGKLEYTPDEQGNVIPDFSHVGYMYGDEAIPDVPVAVEVTPVEGDDGANIQAAINQVAAMSPDANGFRGAVLLKKGTYEVRGQLIIRSSGVVLRGEGMTDEGTVIIADGTGQRDLIVIGNGASRSDITSSKVDIIEDFVPLGRRYVVVEDASGYSEGDHIALYRPGTSNWISDLQMDQIPDPDGSTKQWTPSSYSFYFERLVTKVSGDTIFFRNPVVMAMETKYGGGTVNKIIFNRIEKVGIEDICFKSAYAHDYDENHAWTAVEFNTVQHSWARRVTSWYFGFACVSINGKGKNITVEDCHSREPKSIITGGRRYSFQVSGALNLVKDCSTTEGRHDYATGSRVCGPNVFTNCSATTTYADIGPHHRWAMGGLFDKIVTDGSINVQDRGASGSGHGWAGANQVFWNSSGASSICQNPWVSAKNYNFGFIGEKKSGWHHRPDGVWVGHNRPGIMPESLYQAQWQERVNNVRVFSVYSELKRANDSSFILSFNMPFMEQLAAPHNFSVSGNAGYEGAEFTVEVLSDTAVVMIFEDISPLPALSSVIIKVQNMFSTDGKTLEGLKSATFFEPDLRPVVTGLYTEVNNEDGILEASSTKPGSIYIAWFNEEFNNFDAYESVSYLDSAVDVNLGRKADAPVANTAVTFSTEGLPGGYYLYVAVDEEGRVSEPADEWPEVLATGPVWGEDTTSVLSDEFMIPGFAVWSSHEKIIIQPDDHSLNYSVRLYGLTGRLLYARDRINGDLRFAIPNYHGILCIHLISDNGSNIGAYKLLYDTL